MDVVEKDMIDFDDPDIPLGDQPDFVVNDDPVIFDDYDVPLGGVADDMYNPETGVNSTTGFALAAAGASAILMFACGKRRKKK